MKKFLQKIQFKFQRAKKGYCDEDLYSIYDWFIEIFSKMLGEFIECTCGYPLNTKELTEEVSKMPKMWVEQQRSTINKILKKYNSEFDLNDGFCCWLLILLRMKHCFELCDEFNDYKKEAFDLFEKYFFALWW